MGHLRLLSLPASQKWTHVVARLGLGAGVEEIAAGASDAAERSLQSALDDPGLAQAVWLLARLPIAARSSDFEGELSDLGIEYGERSLLEIAGGAVQAVEAAGRRDGGRTDLGEIAALALGESLSALVGRGLPGLFGASAADVQRELGRYASREGFSELAREFFARLTRRQLDYYLSRALSNHVGPDRRFGSSGAQSEFNRSLDLHCREASRIIKEYAGAWLSKARYEGTLTPASAKAFAAYAFAKMAAELRRRRDAHG